MAPPRWQIVIVNFRTAELAVRSAVDARAALSGPGEIVVVDSASGDHSLSRLGPVEGIRVLALPENRGFGAALNAGARISDSEFLLCQNADVTYGPELLADFEERFAQLPPLGLVAPRLASRDGTVQPSCRRFPTHFSLLWSRGSPLARRVPRMGRSYILPEPLCFTLCDVVAGACFAVRREVWRHLDGMDERFFLYAEDTDFCLRAKAAGWLVGYEPAVCAQHLWGASTGQNRAESARHQVRSLSLYMDKHFPRRRLANMLLTAAMRIRVRGKSGEPPCR